MVDLVFDVIQVMGACNVDVGGVVFTADFTAVHIARCEAVEITSLSNEWCVPYRSPNTFAIIPAETLPQPSKRAGDPLG